MSEETPRASCVFVFPNESKYHAVGDVCGRRLISAKTIERGLCWEHAGRTPRETARRGRRSVAEAVESTPVAPNIPTVETIELWNTYDSHNFIKERLASSRSV